MRFLLTCSNVLGLSNEKRELTVVSSLLSNIMSYTSNASLFLLESIRFATFQNDWKIMNECKFEWIWSYFHEIGSSYLKGSFEDRSMICCLISIGQNKVSNRFLHNRFHKLLYKKSPEYNHPKHFAMSTISLTSFHCNYSCTLVTMVCL